MEESKRNARRFKRKRYARCGVRDCGVSSTEHPQYSFYVLPANPDRRALWMRALKIPQKVNAKPPKIQVCEKHFERKYVRFNYSRRRLAKSAMPTLFLPEHEVVCPPSPDSHDVSPNNDDIHLPEDKVTASFVSLNRDDDNPSKNEITPSVPVKVEPTDSEAASTNSNSCDMSVKRKLNEIVEYNKSTKLVKIKEEKDCLTVFVEDNNEEDNNEEDQHEDTFIANQLVNISEFENQRNPVGEGKTSKKKYSTDFKMFALKLYFKSPNPYRLLQRTFNLPRISTLYRLCIPAKSELSQDVLRALSIKVKGMSSAQKECVVCIGTMSLSQTIEYDPVHDKIIGFHEVDGVETLEPAKYALVVMVRGLFHDWKQALGFSFLSNFENHSDVNLFIDDIIRKLLFEIKLNVRVLMSDLLSDMRLATKERGLHAKSPFFYVANKKIYYMYEPLDLMRNVRDHLMYHSIVFDNGLVAKWHYLFECYEYDRKKCLLRLAPKLLEDHVIKRKYAKHDLKHTAELFSRATATALATYSDLKVLGPQAKDTSLWVLTMSRILDILNFSTVDPPEDKSAVFSGEKKQVEFLVHMLSMFYNLRTDARFKEGFKITIDALLLLHEELNDENCCSPIIGLSHDCLHIFFDKCSQGLSCQPTAKQMLMSVTKCPIFNIFQYSFEKRSAGDLETFLSELRQMPDIKMYDEEHIESYVDTYAKASADFSAVVLPKENKMEHLALYLLYKGYQEHSDCQIMKEYVRSKDIIEDYRNLMPLVGYKTQKCGSKLNLVPEEFVAFVEILDIKFKEYFKENRTSRFIAGLQSCIRNDTFRMPCECFPLDFIKQLYLRYRLYNVMEYNNLWFSNAETTSTPVLVVNDL